MPKTLRIPAMSNRHTSLSPVKGPAEDKTRAINTFLGFVHVRLVL